MHAINVASKATITQVALPKLKKWAAGRIVDIRGEQGERENEFVHYLGIGRAPPDQSSGRTRVTVNAILPSIFDTPANKPDMHDADYSTSLSHVRRPR